MDKSANSTGLPLILGFVGAFIGLPLSYFFQPAIIRVKLSLPEYLSKMPELFSSNFPGKEKIVLPIILSCIICAAISALIGYLIEKNRPSTTETPYHNSKENKFSKIDTTQPKGLNKEILAVIDGYKARIGADPLNTSLILELANFLNEKCLFDRAIPTLLKLITIDSENITALKLLMHCYESTNRYEDAINIGNKILEINDDDLENLSRIADLYLKLDKLQEMLSCLDIITDKDPSDKDTWIKKAETYETLGIDSEALKAWQNVNRIDPRNSIANLKLAINMADSDYYGQAIPIFNKILNDFDKDDENSEIMKFYLLWCSIKSDNEVDKKDIENLMKNVSISKLDILPIANKNLKSGIYELYGDSEAVLERYDSAIKHFMKAYDKSPSKAIEKKLAQTYLREGTSFFSNKNLASAIYCFQEGLLFDSENAELKYELSSAISKRKRKKALKFSLATAVLMLIAVSYGLYYLSHESFNIKVNPKANITLIREKDLFSTIIKKEIFKDIIEDTIILDETKFLNTGYLFPGTYQIKAKKFGYENFEKTIKTGFRRKQNNIHIELMPLLGSVKVDSDPRNATVIIKNAYQIERGRTPCEIKNIFAIDSEISVSLAKFNSYKIIKKIPKNERLDLGTISFEGTLLIDSLPTDALVYVNKKNIGKTPIKINKLPAIETTIEVIKKDFGSYISHVEVLPHQEIDLGTVKLSNLCTLKVHSQPVGATTLLDGKIVGITPILLSDIKSGRHKLTLKHIGYAPYEKELNIQPGENLEFNKINLNSWIDKPLLQKSRWKAKIQINSLDKGEICGRIDFRSLKCGGNLIYYRKDSHGLLFKENLNYGKCVKGCLIWISEDGKFYEEICKNKRTGFGRIYFGQEVKETKNSKSIGGYWELRNKRKPHGDPVNWMKISSFGNSILVRGKSWSGKGGFNGKEGYYNWKLNDGQTGRTEIFMDRDGRLNGKVRGRGVNWNYIATFVK